MSPGDYLIWYAVFACATQLAMASTKLLSREATLFVNNVRLPDTHAGYKVIRTDVSVRLFRVFGCWLITEFIYNTFNNNTTNNKNQPRHACIKMSSAVSAVLLCTTKK